MINPIFSFSYTFPILVIFAILCLTYSNKNLKLDRYLNINKLDIGVVILIAFIIINKAYKTLTPLGIKDFYSIITYSLLYQVVRLYSKAILQRVQNKVLILFALLAGIEIIVIVGELFSYGVAKPILGSFGDRAVLGNFLTTILPFTIYLWYNHKKYIKWQLVYGCLSIFLLFVILFLTKSRTAAIVTVSILLTILFIEKKEGTVFKSKISKFVFIPLVGIALIFCFTYLLNVKANSTSGRWFILKNETGLLMEHPVTGIGFGNFDKYYNDYQANYFKTHTDPKNTYLANYINVNYNEYLDFVLKGGVIGLLLMLFLIYIIAGILIDSFKRESQFLRPYAACVITILIMAIFSYPSENMPTLSIFFISIAILNSYNQKILFSLKVDKTYVFALCTLFYIPLFLAIVLLLNASIKWEVLSQNFNKKTTTLSETNNLYISILRELDNNPSILEDYANKLYICKDYENAARVLNLACKYSSKFSIYTLLGNCYENLGKKLLAEKSYLKASYLVPNLFYPKYLLMRLYYINNNINEAKKWALIIENMPIKVQSIIVTKAKQQANKLLNQNR